MPLLWLIVFFAPTLLAATLALEHLERLALADHTRTRPPADIPYRGDSTATTPLAPE
ncbi:MAG: hypothetical protein J2P19_17555 [Pseudonocardia sp.]|nr:hypothetical protein [Pseudonocardia sp.]